MIRNDLPFRSQHWDLGDWKALGFDSRESAEYWQSSSCGVLCLGMILEERRSVTTADLIKDGKRIGAYTHKNGWSHDGLVELAKEYDLKVCRKERISIELIKYFLDSGNVLISSIKWAFVPHTSFKEKIFFWRRSGGHLALITGYDDLGFYVHHTSIRSDYNWKDRLIPYQIFSAAFTGRAIIVKL